jgi:hypothetical protein
VLTVDFAGASEYRHGLWLLSRSFAPTEPHRTLVLFTGESIQCRKRGYGEQRRMKSSIPGVSAAMMGTSLLVWHCWGRNHTYAFRRFVGLPVRTG